MVDLLELGDVAVLHWVRQALARPKQLSIDGIVAYQKDWEGNFPDD